MPDETTPAGGMTQVRRMLVCSGDAEPDVILFIDEAERLTEIQRPGIVSALLSGLLNTRQQSRSRGPYRLRSFSLVGTAKTRSLFGISRGRRIGDYHDALALDVSQRPLAMVSVERQTEVGMFQEEDIASMLRQYSQEHAVKFDESELRKLAKNVYALTSGYKGLVGCCCEYIQTTGITSVARWKREVKTGAVSGHVFNHKVYSGIVSNVASYWGEPIHLLMSSCMLSPRGSSCFNSRDIELILPAVNDGVLRGDPGEENSYSITSGLVHAALLEECVFRKNALRSTDAVLEEIDDEVRRSYEMRIDDGMDYHIDDYEDAVRWCFRFCNSFELHDPEVRGFIWTTDFLLALKFVFQKAWIDWYDVVVDCKRRGNNLFGLDFLLKSHESPPSYKAFQVHPSGDGRSIQEHMWKAEEKRELLGERCEMNYMYFTAGESPAGKAAAVREIEQESENFRGIKCWLVAADALVWDVREKQDSGWHSVLWHKLRSGHSHFTFESRE